MMSANKKLKVSNNSSVSEVPSASISNLPNDLLKHCFSFIPGSYVTVAPVSRQFFSNYSTVGLCDSVSALSTDVLLKIGKNKRTTADAVASDIKLTEYCLINEAPEAFMIKVCQKAAAKGRTDIIECAHILGIDVKKVVGKWAPRHENLMKKLAKEGNLEMMKYFDNRFPETVADGNLGNWRHALELAMDHFQLTIDHRNLHVMKWIVEEKQKREDLWSVQAFEGLQKYDKAFEDIKANKHLRGDMAFTESVISVAAQLGNIEVLEHCQRNNCQFYGYEFCLALFNKDKEKALETLKWLHRHHCPWDDLCEQAARHDHLEALKWARSEGSPWDENTLEYAAKNGNIAMLEYCLQNECPMTSQLYTSALSNDDHHTAIEVMKTLRKYSCPWVNLEDSLDAMTCFEAIRIGNFEAMFWAKRNGYPWTEEDFCNLVQEGHVSAIEEALQDEPHFDVNDLFHVNEILGAALKTKSSHVSCIIEKLKLLRRYGYKWNAQTSVFASKLGQLQVLQWIRYMGYPMNSPGTAAIISEHSKVYI